MDPPTIISLTALTIAYLTYRETRYEGTHRKRKRYRRGKRK